MNMRKNKKALTKNNIFDYKTQKAITLIALVITIIILLILAGVTIAALTGDNGILKSAIKAKEETEKAGQEEAEILNDLENAFTQEPESEEVPKVNDATPGKLSGDGTEENSYKIESAEDLINFLLKVESGKQVNFAGETIKLMTNLDLASKNSYVDPNSTTFGDYNGDGQTKGIYEEINDRNYTGLKWKYIKFEGVFDGNSNEIKNIYSKISDAYGEIGFIAYNNGGTIKNLTLSGEYQIEGIENEYTLIGALIGINKNGNIINCTNNIRMTLSDKDSEFKSSNRIGGVVGKNEGLVKNCINKAELLVDIENTYQTTVEAGVYVGGIIGNNAENATVNGCINYGKIDVNLSVKLQKEGNYKNIRIGGIVGTSDGRVINSVNYADLNVKDKRLGFDDTASIKLGGIAGNNGDGGLSEITNVINYGNINGETDDKLKIGGTVGENDASTPKLRNAYNKGTVTGKANTSELLIGGIIGDGEAIITRTYNTGNVVANSETKYIGGIIGDLHSDTNVTNSKYLSSTASGAAQGEETKGVERVDTLDVEEIKTLLNEGVKELNTQGDLIEWTNIQ